MWQISSRIGDLKDLSISNYKIYSIIKSVTWKILIFLERIPDLKSLYTLDSVRGGTLEWILLYLYDCMQGTTESQQYSAE